MKEDILQYIWRFQYYNLHALKTTAGDQVMIIHPGSQNADQGPDFLEARVKINETVWAGNIEIHVNSSHWNLHHHSSDENYCNVILHVVWNHDADISDANGHVLPTLELKTRVSKLLIERYRQMLHSSGFIPCEKSQHQLSELAFTNFKQRLVAERLIDKSHRIREYFRESGDHWEETFWWLIAANMGLKINGDVFMKIAKSLPQHLLAKHKHNAIQIEAMLFGQAGLLNESFTEKYPQLLQREYVFYKRKYSLPPVDGSLFFLRMRPANFPSIRLAQLATLIHQSEHLFSKIRETDAVSELTKMLSVSANDYWHYHYVFGEESTFMEKKLGSQMINNIIINTVVPILFLYGLHHNEEHYKEKSISWLEQLPAEKNAITKGYQELGFENKNAFDSQALIQLKNNYCRSKRCLSCAIGNSILKKEYVMA